MVEEYRKSGFIHFPKYIDYSQLCLWAEDLHWLVACQLQRFKLKISSDLDPIKKLSSSLIRLHQYKPEAQSWIYNEVNRRPWMFELACNKELNALVKNLLCSDQIGIHPRLNMVMSMPGDTWHTAQWHQDRFFGPANHLVAYIPLQDTGEYNGGLIVAPSGHRNGLLRHESIVNSKTKWITIEEQEVNKFSQKKQLLLKAGDLLIFDGLLPHTANTNRSNDVRFAISIRYTNLNDPFFIDRGWCWEDLAVTGLAALKKKEINSHEP